MTLSRPSLKTSSMALASNSCMTRETRSTAWVKSGSTEPGRSRRVSSTASTSAVVLALSTRSMPCAISSSSAARYSRSRLSSTCLTGPTAMTSTRLALRSAVGTMSMRRMRQAWGLMGVAMAAEPVALASVEAASRNHCSLANSTWPNW